MFQELKEALLYAEVPCILNLIDVLLFVAVIRIFKGYYYETGNMNNTIPFEDLNSNVDGKNEMRCVVSLFDFHFLNYLTDIPPFPRDFETSIALNLISLINSKSDVYWSLQLAEMSYNRDFLYAYETKRYKTDKPPRIHSEAFTDDGFKYFSFESIGPLKRLGMFSALAIPCKYDREKYETVFNTTNCESILDKCRRKAIEYADPYNIKAHDRGDPLSWYRTIDVHGLLNRQVEAGLLKQKPENFNYMVNGKDYIVISDSVQNDINFYCLLPEYFQTIKGFENSIMKDPNTRGSHRDHKLYLDTVLAGMGIIVKRGDENNSIIHDEYADKLFREAIAKAVFAIFCRNYTVGTREESYFCFTQY